MCFDFLLFKPLTCVFFISTSRFHCFAVSDINFSRPTECVKTANNRTGGLCERTRFFPRI